MLPTHTAFSKIDTTLALLSTSYNFMVESYKMFLGHLPLVINLELMLANLLDTWTSVTFLKMFLHW